MRYTLYEDAITHKFALLRVPNRFVEGDKLTILATDRWFDSHEAAVAALPELLNREECEPGTELDDAAPADDGCDSS